MKIAIVGSGISGLGAAHVLQRAHHVEVFEKEAEPGGHAHTVEVPTSAGAQPVDTGFIVYNEPNYPLLTRLFAEVQVETMPSDMSFGVHDPAQGWAYSSRGLPGLLATPRNLLRPAFYSMVKDILRFNKCAKRALNGPAGTETLGEFLHSHRFSPAFIEGYISPMSSAIWSAPPGKTLAFPAWTFFRFFNNHGLLSTSPDIPWRTVKGGSREYVRAVTRPFADRLHTNTPVQRIERRPDGVRVYLNDGPALTFDAIVLAVHADQALRLLADPSDEETTLLSRYPYQANRTVLHNDASLLPKQSAAWASWNVRLPAKLETDEPLAMHYDMNRLQSIPGPESLLVTLNPETQWIEQRRGDTGSTRIYYETTYEHPAYRTDSFTKQNELQRLNGPRNTYYCGAYFGYGFHEDGLASGVHAARALGVEWQP